MKLAKIKSIFKKEMMDLLRDKKTLIMMVLVPLLLYPLIMMVAMLVGTKIATSMEEAEYKVAIMCDSEMNTIKEGEKEEYSDFFNLYEFINFIEDTEDEYEYHLRVVNESSPKKMQELLLSEDIDAIINIHSVQGKINFEVQYLSSVTNSNQASNMISNKLKLYQQHLEEKKLSSLGLDSETLMHPIEVKWSDQSNKEEKVGSILGSILPFLLITSILMGAVYPAIDTTAGEKERGTLETLLTLPVKNDELILGKFFAVALVAVVSAILNLLSMGIMAVFMFGMIESGTPDAQAVNLNLAEFIPALVIVILCVIAFAMFISAITMCVTTFAKSYKEANNYITPLLLVVMFTGYIGFIPNITFTPLLAAVPVVNICLLVSNLLVFKYNLYLIIIVLLSNVAYAFLAVWILGKIYNSEDIVFGESGVSFQIFTSRKDLKKGGVPTFSDALLVMSVMMLLLFYVGSILQVKFLLMGLLMTQIMIFALPVFAAWYTKKDLKETFSIKIPGITEIFGAILLEIGTYVLIMPIGNVLQKIWPQDLERVEESFSLMLNDMTFVPTLLIMALAPAICEEVLFRGYLFSSVKKKFKPLPAILIVAAIFGIYHMSFIKFFTTGILGFAFTYVVYKTESIFCSSIMHFLNNGFVVVLTFFGAKWLEKLSFLSGGTLGVKEILMEFAMIVLGIGGGIVLLNWKNKKSVS